MSIVTDLPTTSFAAYPNNRSAPRFQLVMMPLRSLLAMASSEDSTIALNNRCMRSAVLRSVISRATFDAPTATGYEAAVRRAEERVLVDRVMWLATASPNGEVRAIASLKLSKLAARLKAAVAKTEADTAQRTLIAADIKRFLERPAEAAKMIPAADAPPGAPIGDPGEDWLAPPPWSSRTPVPIDWNFWEEPEM